MPQLSAESLMLLNIAEGVCLDEQMITKAIFNKKAKSEVPPYINYQEFLPKVRDGITEKSLSFIHQESGMSNEEVKILAKKEINPHSSLWYLAQLLIHKIAEMRYENGSKMNLVVERDNLDFDKHTSVYPVSDNLETQQAVATALAFVAGQPIKIKGVI